MKETTENISMLKKMGFVSEGDGWYSLKSGWGFRIDIFSSIAQLVKRMMKVEDSLMNGRTGLCIDDLPEIKKIIGKYY